MTAGLMGNRYAGRKPGWHDAGISDMPTGTLASEAVVLGKADFNIYTLPLAGIGVVNGERKYLATDKVGIYREPVSDDPKWQYLGSAAPGYTVLQNREIGELLDPISREWPVDTVGVLGKGETLFIALDAGEGSVGGEPISKYFLVTDTRDGGTSLRIVYTPVRVVCQNTLSTGLSEAVMTAAISHTAGIKEQTEWRIGIMRQMERGAANVDAKLNRLAFTRVVDGQVDQILRAAYPEPKPGAKVRMMEELRADGIVDIEDAALKSMASATDVYAYMGEAVAKKRALARGLYERINDEHPEVAGTAWAVVNGVVEFEDYRQGGPNARRDAVFGQRAVTKARAFKEAFLLARV